MEIDKEKVQEYARQYGQVVAKAWADEAFKARFLADPAAVLKEEGIPVAEGIELRAVENTDKVMYISLPPRPSEELSDEQLNQVAGGLTAGTSGSLSTFGTVGSTVSSASCAGTIGTAS